VLAVITPTDKQIQNCELMGWEYLGEGLFCRGDEMGYFTAEGFEKV
jgi:hypothetical protein